MRDINFGFKISGLIETSAAFTSKNNLMVSTLCTAMSVQHLPAGRFFRAAKTYLPVTGVTVVIRTVPPGLGSPMHSGGTRGNLAHFFYEGGRKRGCCESTATYPKNTHPQTFIQYLWGAPSAAEIRWCMSHHSRTLSRGTLYTQVTHK